MKKIENKHKISNRVRQFTMPPPNHGSWGWGHHTYDVPTDAYAEEMALQPIVNLTLGEPVNLYDIKYPLDQEDTTMGSYNNEEYNRVMVDKLNDDWMTPTPDFAFLYRRHAMEILVQSILYCQLKYRYQ